MTPEERATQLLADAELGREWRLTEAALPKGWGVSVALEREDGQATARAGRIAFSWPPKVVMVDGPTPAAALRALRERLGESMERHKAETDA